MACGSCQLTLAPLQILPALAPSLSNEERVRLRALELTIEKNLTGFIACGRALLEIRSSRLYRESHATFADYCRERFAIARSTADQLCRSTQVYETLWSTLADSDTPVSETTPEIVLRPLTSLPDPDLQKETWRLAASLSPDKKPTRTITARVTRMIREAVNGQKGRMAKNTEHSEKDVMFTRPISRLSRIRSFTPELACLHVKTPGQALSIATACQIVAERCSACCVVLEKMFPDAFPRST